MEAFLAIISVISYVKITNSLPPAQCFANFRWDDCGEPPKPVMYYWKPGSRCEVGIWRGCLPNLNMFKDEYECVSTCIFSMRAHADNWHLINQEDETTTEPTSTTEVSSTIGDGDGNSTGATGGQNTTDVDGETTDSGQGSDSTNADETQDTTAQNQDDPTTTEEA